MSRLVKLLGLMLMLPATVFAADPTASTPLNMTLLALVSLIVILVFANCLLANVLKQLAYACRDKMVRERADKTIAKSVFLAIGICCSALGAFAQEAMNATEQPLPPAPYISGIPRTDFYAMLSIIGFLMLVMLVLIGLIRMMTRELRGIPAKAHMPRLVFRKNFLDIFNKSVAVDKEESIMLDHDYDGIHELDNDLPPWWKWGFVLTIIVSVIYVGYYHAAGGPSQIEEYTVAVEKGEREKAEYLAKAANNVDENTVTMVLDGGALADAQTIFQNACAACHAKDGGGGVGPNLTDNYWLHGGGIKDVFKSIKYGWQDKGMKSWKDDYSPKQIAALASYIKTLNGTTPAAPKEAQGELFVEGGDGAIDSVGNKTAPSLSPAGIKENKDNPVGPYTNKADGKVAADAAGVKLN